MHPFGSAEKALLERFANPESIVHKDKYYLLAARSHTIGSYKDEFATPFVLEGRHEVTFYLGDDLAERGGRPAPEKIGIRMYW